MNKFRVFGLLAASTLLAACVPQQQMAQPVYSGPTYQQSRVCDTSFRVANQSGMTVREFYFSPSSVNGWGVDQLRASVLPPGNSVNYRANNSGRYDFRVVWMNGRAAELRGVNICAASQITVRNNGLSAF